MYQLVIAALWSLTWAGVSTALPTDSNVLSRRWANWGHATYYNPGGNLGSCGWPSDDSHHVVALSPSQNPKGHCGQHVWLKNVGGGNAGANGGVGRTIDAVVVDTCPRCGYSDIDIAEGAAWALHGPGLHEDGVFDVEWGYY